MKTIDVKAKINEGLLDSTLTDLCSVAPAKIEGERARYCAAADAFNSVYGEVLVEPDVLLPETQAAMRLPGTDGKAKMSKSLGNCIYLADTADDVRKKVMSMYTDPLHIQVSDPGHVEGNTVFTYLDAFSRQEHFERYLPDYANLDELKAHYTRGGLGDMVVKRFLNNVLQEELEPIRNKRKEYKYTQEEFSIRSGLGLRFIRELEQGKLTLRRTLLPQK